MLNDSLSFISTVTKESAYRPGCGRVGSQLPGLALRTQICEMTPRQDLPKYHSNGHTDITQVLGTRKMSAVRGKAATSIFQSQFLGGGECTEIHSKLLLKF